MVCVGFDVLPGDGILTGPRVVVGIPAGMFEPARLRGHGSGFVGPLRARTGPCFKPISVA